MALEIARWAQGVGARRNLKDQLVRAADSVVLNIAEGAAQSGDARRNHFRIALGSAAEVAAVMDLLGTAGTPVTDIRRVGAMLAKLATR
ncbi:MAG: four helix bundle protein [Deltaproteobacteria bacterium]|nr:four helix bundle protein [Deltaproteobacteria bacterium]